MEAQMLTGDASRAYDMWMIATGFPGFLLGLFLVAIVRKVKERDTSTWQWSKNITLMLLLPFAASAVWASFGMAKMNAIVEIQGSLTVHILQGSVAAASATFCGLLFWWAFFISAEKRSQ